MGAHMIAGFFTPWIVYAIATFMHVALPALRREGYARHEETGKLLEYKLNGHLVLPGSIFLWLVLGYIQLVPWTWLYEARWYSLAGAVTFGLLFTIAIVLPQRADKKNIFADLWFGRLKNPRCQKGNLLIDAKVWLYLCGAIMLQLNVLSAMMYHWEMFFDPYDTNVINPGFLIGVAMLTFFIWDYLNFEKVHLYTYGFTAERVGFKLGFGCLAFYPFFYAIALWSTAHLPNPGRPNVLNALFVLVFLFGWVLARGANLQKYYFKVSPRKKFLGIRPETLTDGKLSLLANGWWGKSRHISYLGEILMACAIALAAGPNVLSVWLYPLYCIVFLFARQANDDKICKAKYGELWDRYTTKVKYRIIPRIW